MIFKIKLVKSVFLLSTAGHIFLHQCAVLVTEIIRVKWMCNYIVLVYYEHLMLFTTGHVQHPCAHLFCP